MFNCRTMRSAVILSALLLGVGVVLGALALVAPFPAFAAQLSLLLVLAAALLLAVTFVTALLPGMARRMDECRH
jgi:zinc transporter ZupT